MAGVAGPELCAAVAEAGGIGTLAAGSLDTATAVAAVAQVKELTDRPFSVNFIAFGLARDASPLDAVLDAGVHSVTLSFADASPYVDRIHRAGALVIQQVQTVEAAAAAVAAGVDLLIAQGNEAGGHTGQIPLFPLFPLLPQIVDVAGGIPVLAAGGIGDGRGLAAALMLGASGAVMGTRFIVAEESEPVWPKLTEQVLAASSADTAWSGVFDIVSGGGESYWPAGIGARSIQTPFLERWRSREHELASAVADVVAPPPDLKGDERDPTPAYAGPIAGMLSRREPAAAIVAEVAADAERELRRATALLGN